MLRHATDWTVRGWNPGGGEIFRTRPDRPWITPSLLYSGHRVIPWAKTDGARLWPSTPSSVEVKDRVELHFYSSFGPSWPVPGWTLPLFTQCKIQRARARTHTHTHSHIRSHSNFSKLSFNTWQFYIKNHRNGFQNFKHITVKNSIYLGPHTYTHIHTHAHRT